MDARRGMVSAAPVDGGRGTPAPVIEDFVRFCYHRRRVGWPELYDEMCAVAARRTFRGWGFAELAEQGICFTLSDLPGLAAVAAEVSRQERERRRHAAQATRASVDGAGATDRIPERAAVAPERASVAPDVPTIGMLRAIPVGAD